jgi:predicted ABC-type ATPase
MTDDEIREATKTFAKRNKIRLAKELTDPKKFHPEETPISVFMAGSPGAGKTEFSKSLIGDIEAARQCNVVRIDADEIRSQIPGYVGGNAHLFQGATSLIVEKVHDLVLSQSQTFILDGTLSNYEKAMSNIDRSLQKQRKIFIFYIYQKPEIAWKFTEAREATEGRNIPKAAFIEQFIAARDTVGRVRNKLGEELVLFFIRKNFENDAVDYIEIPPGKSVDHYFDRRYTQNELKNLL